MIEKLLAKIFGTKNDRELRKIRPVVEQINDLEQAISPLSDDDLAAQTDKFRERLNQGASLEDLLPEAFATVRETGKRKLNQRHFDVQLIGGMVLHRGCIAEMKTGEGKTLTATLPLYLNALAGKGAHLVTVNDYLARRDAGWMTPIYNHLKLEVASIQHDMNDQARKKVYGADITYGTNNEFGFDYLRDNMKSRIDDCVQRELHFAIVDEVDSILIDEARTPLIISGASEKDSNLYEVANQTISYLKKEDFEIDEKERTVHLTETGVDRVESALRLNNLYAPENIQFLHHITQALRARTLFKRDVDYMVRDGEVLIVDEHTGRVLSGRRYSDGLHQALEAKEGVKIEQENQTLASITLQNYFRLYTKLSGMTGTAMTEAGEFYKIYKLGVISVPTHRTMIRNDQPDVIFLSKEDKAQVVIDDIKDCHKRGQPVLVGTISIESSEYFSNLLRSAGVPHNVLNAKHHEREAEIIAEAGEKGKVTIATNMAGRGTDIKLGSGVLELGGLRIIGTERHESRRIDNQLRGRSGRQGDPGSSKFYLSLDDDLMRIFGGPKLKNTMMRLGMKPGESIEHRMVTRSIEKAQEKVEKHNFDIRKHLLEYDDVLNKQRTVIYKYRRAILAGSDGLKDFVKDLISDVIEGVFAAHYPDERGDEKGLENLCMALHKLTALDAELFRGLASAKAGANLRTEVVEFLLYEYEQYRGMFAPELIDEIETWVFLETVDQAWKNHLQNLDHLKEGIGLRGYGQKNPLLEYKKESFVMFEQMMEQITWDIVQRIFRIRPSSQTSAALQAMEKKRDKQLSTLHMSEASELGQPQTQSAKRNVSKVGRNDVCPCGSEQKYKKCCGKE